MLAACIMFESNIHHTVVSFVIFYVSVDFFNLNILSFKLVNRVSES